MPKIKLMPNAIFIFIFSLVALLSSFVLYIYWYIEISSGLDDVVLKFDIDPHQVFESQPAVVVVVLSLLAGFIFTGLSMTFIYNLKMQQLYRLQNNFINNFTHELKTPVTSLKLYLETFQKHELSREEQNKCISFMLQDVHRLSGNISNILDLGRIESRHFQGEFFEQHLIKFVDNFYVKNAYLFQGASIKVDLSNYNDPNYVNAEYLVSINESLFEMLLINLASNAVKYNESVTPELVVSFSRNEKNINMTFSDNGIGIERKQSKKIFKKFYQTTRANITSTVGSGIGLYLVHNIIHAHKGKIKVNSSGKGKGATFTVTIPALSTLAFDKTTKRPRKNK
ncbi:MAG: two-component system phosphate regulon sensor histidine kinase PhoR [Pseudohongiellaceae bacterium]|jgi:two-component system phosphate regulon sensor histidine kinase PhoR